jgi:RNA polymerase primary sigma factor
MTINNVAVHPQKSQKFAELAASKIAFIGNETFEATTERDLREADVELYRDEEIASGAYAPDSAESPLVSSLRESRLLTFEGEQLLFKRLNFLRFRANAIQMTLDSQKPARKKMREMERLLDEAASVRDELAESNLRLVASVAGKLSKSREEFEEFFAEGNGILLYAIDKFDYARGYRFSTYLTHSVQRHLYRVINRRRKRADREISREPETLMTEVAAAPQPDSISDLEVKEAVAAVIAQIDETLDERERFIVRGRFGLDGSGKGKTYTDLGQQIGLSKERVRQLFQRGMEKLGEIAKPFESAFSPG